MSTPAKTRKPALLLALWGRFSFGFPFAIHFPLTPPTLLMFLAPIDAATTYRLQLLHAPIRLALLSPQLHLNGCVWTDEFFSRNFKSVCTRRSELLPMYRKAGARTTTVVARPSRSRGMTRTAAGYIASPASMLMVLKEGLDRGRRLKRTYLTRLCSANEFSRSSPDMKHSV